MATVKRGEFLTGLAGSAQELLFEREADDPVDWQGTIGHWFIHAPGQSPAWQNYTLAAVHLRPIEGGSQEARVNAPDRTHEFILAALDPEGGRDPLKPEDWRFLRPINLAEQVKYTSDAVASRALRGCARGIVDGALWAEPPLSGQVEPWRSYLQTYEGEIA
jgi:hypothetical protein